jgi:hypothetical protein
MNETFQELKPVEGAGGTEVEVEAVGGRWQAPSDLGTWQRKTNKTVHIGLTKLAKLSNGSRQRLFSSVALQNLY